MRVSVPTRTLLMTILTVALVLSGCLGSEEVVRTGDLETYDTFVEVGPAEAVEVNLDMGRGQLQVRPGSVKLMEATFRYNVDQWKPRFTYVEQADLWNLTVTQPKQGIEVEGETQNEWDLVFGNMVPMAMSAQVGAGNVNVRATGLDLVSLSVSTGAGDVDMDLSGRWFDHLVARAGTGTGNVKLIVPSDMGVQISVVQGVGTVIAPGFTEIQGNYKNAAFDTAELIMLIAVDIGTGDLQVLQVP
ncbi:MAG: hypothetical protein JSW25_07500 [Thermoplasmata archaeon]|nr:MAG: hypothetical protein JSW25_07500 [Thermoplasmata archaeon]